MADGCSNKQSQASVNLYRPLCTSCHQKRYGLLRNWRKKSRAFRKTYCEQCGPEITYHECQLDVDHIDGNSTNDDPLNYQTLCANCHRLKTYLGRDWESK